MLNILDLNAMDDAALQQLAEQFSIKRADKLSRQDLIYKILDAQAIQQVAKRAEQIQNEGSAEADAGNDGNEEEPVKRKRGRPRIHPIETETTNTEDNTSVPRKRGRPRKIREEETPAANTQAFAKKTEDYTVLNAKVAYHIGKSKE